MAVSQSQIVDLLYKQAFGVTKTDTATNKSPSNESIPSPLLIRGDTQWTQSDQIPDIAAALAGVVQAYTGSNAVQCTADNTTVPISGVYPSWKTNLIYWIPSEFGATYNIQIWVDDPSAANPTVTGTQIFADGSGGTGQWYYNYQSGVLNFIGETIPAVLTSGKVIYVVGYRYIGAIGVTNLPNGVNIGNLTVTNANISTINANANLNLTPNGTGVVFSSANIYAPNFIGNISGNISGNVTVPGANTQVLFNDSNLLGASSSFTFDKVTGLLSITGNINSSGQVVSTANLVTSSNVVTDYISGKTGNINITAVGANSSINLLGTGTGTLNVGNLNISNVGGPTNARDAATKEYVDNAVSAGLTIHEAVVVETPSALTATYAQGGTTPTITTISGGNVITTSTTHNLAIDDMIVFNNSFNGLVAGTPYFVYSVPAADQITVSASYPGPEITTLTSGTGLTQSSRANSGVGATLTSGSPAALAIDGVSLTVGDRVLVYQQANAAQNGIYVVSNAGSGVANWVMTRATDSDKYAPNSTEGMAYGDYFFVSEGDTGAGASYVNNTIGVIIIGTTNITFAQFSDTKVYTAGTGLQLTGTQFSIANTAVTTGTYGNGDRVGQFTVNEQGQLTFAQDVVIVANAANLSGTSLNSNVVSSNLTSVGTLGNLTVAGNIDAVSGAISANIVSANLLTGTLTTAAQPNITSVGTLASLDVNGNVILGNGSGGTISGANLVSANYLTGTLTTASQPNITSVGTLTSLDVTGNISANYFSGNFSGNISGNVTVPGSNTEVLFNDGNLLGANSSFTFNKSSNLLTVTGNIATGGIKTDNYYYANGSPVDFQQAAGANGEIQFNNNDDFAASANLTFNSATSTFGVIGTANITTVNTSTVNVGNTSITSGTTTTTSISANQTIATLQVTTTDITGIEFFVKGVDSAGTKYSVAKIVAVTNGTTVDYTTFATINLGGMTGSLSVNVVSSNVALQVTPSTSNSTVWVTQYRLI
jgi:hypothetical protein